MPPKPPRLPKSKKINDFPKKEYSLPRKQGKNAKKAEYERSEEEAEMVKFLAASGVTQDRIAKTMKLGIYLLRKHYKDEMDSGLDECNLNVVGALYRNAMEGNVAAQIFWTKARLKWRETTEIEHKGNINVTPMISITSHNQKELDCGRAGEPTHRVVSSSEATPGVKHESD